MEDVCPHPEECARAIPSDDGRGVEGSIEQAWDEYFAIKRGGHDGSSVERRATGRLQRADGADQTNLVGGP